MVSLLYLNIAGLTHINKIAPGTIRDNNELRNFGNSTDRLNEYSFKLRKRRNAVIKLAFKKAKDKLDAADKAHRHEIMKYLLMKVPLFSSCISSQHKTKAVINKPNARLYPRAIDR